MTSIAKRGEHNGVKREEVVAGAEYATDLGVHVRVEAEPPAEDGSEVTLPSTGWAVQDGEWVEAEVYKQRRLQDGSYRQYLTTVALRATEVDTGTKVTVEPRRLVATWEDHVAASKRAVAEREDAEANARALTLRAEQAHVHVHTDARKREVRMSFADADTLLRKAKV